MEDSGDEKCDEKTRPKVRLLSANEASEQKITRHV